jgi:biotin carboxyl carrier protein
MTYLLAKPAFFQEACTNMKYRLESGDKVLELEHSGSRVFQNGKEIAFETFSKTGDEMILTIGNRLIRVQRISSGGEGQPARYRVNGKTIDISVKSETDLLLEKMGVGHGAGNAARKIKAPMPGLIVKILVAPGDQVEKGQVLLNFEAMKMENQLKAPGPGIVKQITVMPGDKVDKGQLLVELE